MLGIVMVLLLAYPAMAAVTVKTGSAASPVTIGIKYAVTSDTSFKVELCSSPDQSGLNFSGTRDSRNIEAECQDRATNKSWAVLNNTGDVQQTFYLGAVGDNLGTEGGAIWVKADNSTPVSANRLPLGSTEGSFASYTNVPGANTSAGAGGASERKIFAYANYSSTMTLSQYTDNLKITTTAP